MERIMSEFAKLNAYDVVKSILMAFIVSVLTALYTSLQSGHFPETNEEWRVIFLAAVSSALGYIIKNFLTNSEGEFAKKENKKE